MFKSMTIEEIKKLPNADILGDIETITIIYEPALDEIILNSNHYFYESCSLLVEAYLNADYDKREQFKRKTTSYQKEVEVLDKIISIRHSKETNGSKVLRQQFNQEFKMIGNQTAFWKQLNLIEAIEKAVEGTTCWKLMHAYNWGYIQGIKAERARRKKVSL